MLGTDATPTTLGREVARAAARLAALVADSFPGGLAFLDEFAADGDPADGDPLARLATAFGFSQLDVELLVLAGLTEEHEGFAAVFRGLHPRGEPFASAGLAARLYCRDAADRLALRAALQTGPLAASGAVTLGDGPFFERSVRVADELWPALRGVDAWPAAVRRATDHAPAHGLAEWLDTPAAVRAAVAVKCDTRCTVLVTGESETVAFRRAVALVREAGGVAVGLHPPAIAGADWDRLAGLHALVRGAVPVVKVTPAEGHAGLPPAFADHPGPVVLCGRTGGVTVSGPRPVLAVEVERLSVTGRREVWTRTVPDLVDHAPDLAARFPLEPASAAEVAADVRLVAELDDRPPELADAVTALRARGSLALAAGVRLVRPKARFEALVLPADRAAQLREAVGRVRHQPRVIDEWGFLGDRVGARGVRMLFCGPPGTGKTLAAEVMAAELDAHLLVVDLSRVVSKWLGETERNLAAAFDAAEQARAALFFDEADSLFASRTEMNSAHDRYANLETAFLLARLERFDGLAVLATNLRRNIDPAFTRRLEFVVEFDEPGPDERLALWRCHLPPAAPLAADVDLLGLAASFQVSGGVIRNAAVAAGSLAAADGAAIGRGHLVHAIRREYEKAGRAFPDPCPERNGVYPR